MISKRGDINWPSSHPDLTPMDFFLTNSLSFICPLNTGCGKNSRNFLRSMVDGLEMSHKYIKLHKATNNNFYYTKTTT